ncbi:MAG: spondin domain-containing protein [Hahellaceae bacterium]|nr:spondin domain-containing protein [Hahellaceae bacterium]MCP5209734.1 spondin domain-containing protein [Hahellaceae bacterium]
MKIHTLLKKTAAYSALPLVLAVASTSATAQTIDVKITNLTQGIYFTPLLVSAHASSANLFSVGESASSALQAMAEGGDISGLVTTVSSVGGVSAENPAAGLLAPASSTMVSGLDTGSNDRLSIVAMLLPTNDGFVGLDSWEIPQTAGTYTVYLNGYDAGTEANDEIVNGGGMSGVPGIPANPGANGGENGTGVTTTESNQMIHIHRGNIGDTDATGGISDLDSRIHRWLNPVAKVTITVK